MSPYPVRGRIGQGLQETERAVIAVRKSRILLAIRSIDGIDGRFMHIRDVARQLTEDGWEVGVVAVFLSDYARSCLGESGATLYLYNAFPTDSQWDRVVCYHYALLPALLFSGFRTQSVLWGCMPGEESAESPSLYLQSPGQRLLVHSAAQRDGLQREYALPAQQILFLPSPVPDEFFTGRTAALPACMERLAVIINGVPEEVRGAVSLLRERQVQVTVFGASDTYSPMTGRLLGGFDCVLTTGKAVPYAMAEGIPVFLYGTAGGNGYLNGENYQDAAYDGFSGRNSRRLTAESLATALLEGYAGAVEGAPFLQAAASRDYKASEIVGILENPEHYAPLPDGPFYRVYNRQMAAALQAAAAPTPKSLRLSRELESTMAALTLSQKRLQTRREQQHVLADRVIGAEARAATAQQECEALRHTRSWKITAPLRAVTGVFRKTLLFKGLRSIKHEGLSIAVRKARDTITGKRLPPPAPPSEDAIQIAPGEVDFHSADRFGILATKHTTYIGLLVARQLKRLGFDFILLEEEPQHYEPIPYIIICPLNIRVFPPCYVVYQMEQTVSTRWMTPRYMAILQGAQAVLDYSLVNIAYFQQNPELTDKLYYLPVDILPEEAPPSREAAQDIDVLFYGATNNPHRRAMLDVLQEEFRICIVSSLFGEAMRSTIRRAKVVVNIHYYENALLETTRLCEVLSQGTSVIVSESSRDAAEDARLRPFVDFVDTDDIEAMRERIAYWLGHEEERQAKLRDNRSMFQKVNAFDYYFGRFMLAQDFISFDTFYDMAGSYIHFTGNRICLSLPESADRRAHFDRENRYGFEVFPGLRHTTGWIGCGLSYRFMARKALEQGLGNSIVCEDDVVFPPDFGERLAHVSDFLRQNTDWDIFSGIMASVENTRVYGVTRRFGESFVEVSKLVSMVFNIYSESGCRLLSAWDSGNTDRATNTIDRYLEAKHIRVLTAVPFLVGHEEELSSTLWGLSNLEIYRDMLAESARKMEILIKAFESKQK